jgi:hypothetical protein
VLSNFQAKQAQHPDPQRLMVPGQNGASQVVEAAAAGCAAVALAMRLGIVPAMAGDRGAVTGRAASTLRPAMPADQLVLGFGGDRPRRHPGQAVVEALAAALLALAPQVSIRFCMSTGPRPSMAAVPACSACRLLPMKVGSETSRTPRACMIR